MSSIINNYIIAFMSEHGSDMMIDEWNSQDNQTKLSRLLKKIIPYEKSFAVSNKAKFWHQILNGIITPRDIHISSNKKYWFTCQKCPHIFKSTISSITRGRWCPFCCFCTKKLCEDENCKFCFEKSFVSSTDKALCWHPILNGTFLPRDVFKGTIKKFWFSCPKCSHDFETRLNDVTCKGSWCPFCSNQKLCNDIKCKFCLNNSFASHEKSQYWHQILNEKITPRNVFKGTTKKYWFTCDKCSHIFKSTINSITSGHWCPACKNKTEKKLLEWLKNKYPNMVKFQPRYDWCKNPDTNWCFPYDFEIFGSIIIELDGRQHIDRQVKNWKSPEENQERDKYKMTQALNNGKSVIRILQQDVLNDTYGWEEKLNSAILALKDDLRAKIICIGDCDIYREYMA